MSELMNSSSKSSFVQEAKITEEWNGAVNEEFKALQRNRTSKLIESPNGENQVV